MSLAKVLQSKKHAALAAQELMRSYFLTLAPCLPEMVKVAVESKLSTDETDMVTLRLFAQFHARSLALLEITEINRQAGKTIEAWPVPKEIQDIADRLGVQLT